MENSEWMDYPSVRNRTKWSKEDQKVIAYYSGGWMIFLKKVPEFEQNKKEKYCLFSL